MARDAGRPGKLISEEVTNESADIVESPAPPITNISCGATSPICSVACSATNPLCSTTSGVANGSTGGTYISDETIQAATHSAVISACRECANCYCTAGS